MNCREGVGAILRPLSPTRVLQNLVLGWHSWSPGKLLAEGQGQRGLCGAILPLCHWDMAALLLEMQSRDGHRCRGSLRSPPRSTERSRLQLFTCPVPRFLSSSLPIWVSVWPLKLGVCNGTFCHDLLSALASLSLPGPLLSLPCLHEPRGLRNFIAMEQPSSLRRWMEGSPYVQPPPPLQGTGSSDVPSCPQQWLAPSPSLFHSFLIPLPKRNSLHPRPCLKLCFESPPAKTERPPDIGLHVLYLYLYPGPRLICWWIPQVTYNQSQPTILLFSLCYNLCLIRRPQQCQQNILVPTALSLPCRRQAGREAITAGSCSYTSARIAVFDPEQQNFQLPPCAEEDADKAFCNESDDTEKQDTRPGLPWTALARQPGGECPRGWHH